MLRESIQALLTSLPETAGWEDFHALFNRASEEPPVDWKLPLIACQAVGGDPQAALPAAAAIACIQASIILVDDLLDEDPKGAQHEQGVGPTANLALGSQAAAVRLIETTGMPAERRSEVMTALAKMALHTARGQHLDVHNEGDEDDYWRVVGAKSTPFYGAALQIGALFGGATLEVAEAMYRIGVLVGEVVQLHDDLFDAFHTPARPDWNRPRNNLLMLYALTADHPERQEFGELLAHIDEAQALREAQQILIRCGAVSYCVFHLLQRHEEIRRCLSIPGLSNPKPMLDLLDDQAQPVVTLLRAVDAEVPAPFLERGPP